MHWLGLLIIEADTKVYQFKIFNLVYMESSKEERKKARELNDAAIDVHIKYAKSMRDFVDNP